MADVLLTTTSTEVAVGSTAAAVASSLLAGERYKFASSTACWIRQGTCIKVTFVAKASLVDGETFTLTLGLSKTPTTYEFDVAGDGVKSGNVQINVSAVTTAIQIAGLARTAILAAQTALNVTDNGDGTLTIEAPDIVMSFSETVANGTFAAANQAVPATAGAGSCYVPANTIVDINGDQGPQLGVIQDAVAGKASATRVRSY